MKKPAAVLLALAVLSGPLVATASAQASTDQTVPAASEAEITKTRLGDTTTQESFTGSTTAKTRFKSHTFTVADNSSVTLTAKWASGSAGYLRVKASGSTTWLASTSVRNSPYKDAITTDLAPGTYEVQFAGDYAKTTAYTLDVATTAYYKPSTFPGATTSKARSSKTAFSLTEESRLALTGNWSTGSSAYFRIRDGGGAIIATTTMHASPWKDLLVQDLPAGDYALEFVGDPVKDTTYSLTADWTPKRLIAPDVPVAAPDISSATGTTTGLKGRSARHSFEVGVGGAVTVTAKWNTEASSYFRLYDSAGTVLGSTTMRMSPYSSSLTKDLAAGTYSVEFIGDPTRTTDYTLTYAVPHVPVYTPRSYLMPTGDKYVFSSAKSVWIKDVSAAPLSANTAKQQVNFINQIKKYNGIVNLNYYQYNSPWEIVGGDQKRVNVAFDDCQKKGYTPSDLFTVGNKPFIGVPIPDDAIPATGTDGALTVYSPDTDQLWEFWKAKQREDGSWQACWGGRIDKVSQSEGWFPGFTGTSATGLASSAGAIGIEEAQRGEINHALAIVLPEPAKGFVWPARRSDGFSLDVNGIKEGTRLRLDPSVDVDALKLHPIAKMSAKAAQKYGIIVTDKAGAVALVTESGAAVKAKTGVDPWTALRTKPGASAATPGYAIYDNFPWDKIQVVQEGWGQNAQ